MQIPMDNIYQISPICICMYNPPHTRAVIYQIVLDVFVTLIWCLRYLKHASLFACKDFQQQIWGQCKSLSVFICQFIQYLCCSWCCGFYRALQHRVSAPCPLLSELMFLGVIHLGPIRRLKQKSYEDLLVSGHGVFQPFCFEIVTTDLSCNSFHLQTEQNSV